MNRQKRITYLLEKNLKDFLIKIFDNSHLHAGHHNFNGSNETHMLIELKCKKKINMNRLTIHRKINDLLANEYNTGLHSIEIRIINF